MAKRQRVIKTTAVSTPWTCGHVSPLPDDRLPPMLFLPPFVLSTCYPRNLGRGLNLREEAVIDWVISRLRNLLALGHLPAGQVWINPTSGEVTEAVRGGEGWLARRLADYASVRVEL